MTETLAKLYAEQIVEYLCKNYEDYPAGVGYNLGGETRKRRMLKQAIAMRPAETTVQSEKKVKDKEKKVS